MRYGSASLGNRSGGGHVGTAAAILLTHVLVIAAFGQCQQAKLVPADGAAGDWFGRAVAIDGDVAVVGSPNHDACGEESGAAYIYRQDDLTWVLEAKLQPLDIAQTDRFGWSVAIRGDLAIVGARVDVEDGVASGSAYIFRYDGSAWVEEAKLLASDRAGGDEFGRGVGICGDVALVTCPNDDDNGLNSGSAYIFCYDGEEWFQQAKLLASDSARFYYFGRVCALSGEAAIVGSFGNCRRGGQAGAAYIFRRDGGDWMQQARLFASDADGGDYFGFAVDISGDLAIAGAFRNTDNGRNSGSAYIFRFDGEKWREEIKLLPLDGEAEDWFGRAVAIDGDVAIVTSHKDCNTAPEAGSAYLYRFDGSTWTEQSKLLAADGQSRDWFGRTVSISGDRAVIGTMWDDDNGEDAGSAYVFTGLTGVDCNANGLSDACDILEGRSEDRDGDGVPDECERSCPADLDRSGSVNAADLRIMLTELDQPGARADLDGDGEVDEADLLLLLGAWGPC